MRRAALFAAAVAIAGCGSSSRTATVTRTETAAAPPPTTSTAAPTPTTATGSACKDAGCAVRIVASHGFTAGGATFDPSRSLNVLFGVRSGSADGTAQQAFFFWHGRYIGTDTSDVSAGIRLQSQTDDTATLVYRLYNPQDPQCCSTAGEATVRYRFDGSRLVPLDPIPPSPSNERSSRR
jgi:hypothetical protein